MKKSVFKLVSSILCVLVSIFSSCNNLLSGSLLKENIESQIEYLSQPTVSIQIEMEGSDQGKLYPNGNKDCRVTDKFTVTYTPSKEYQFIKWMVKDYKTGVELTNVLEVMDPEELETEITVIGTGENVSLYPLVCQRPAVENFSPVTLETGSPKDSSIVFTFTKNLSTENDLKRIQITCGGDSVAGNFLDPVLNENILTIAANKNNLLEVASGKIKTVTVRIPEDFYYVEDGKHIPFGSELVYSYNVNTTTLDKAEVTIGVAAEKGEISPKGTQSYNIGDVVKIEYAPSDGYKFNGWSVKDGSGNSNLDSIIKFDNKNSASTNFTVLSDATGISITPVTVLLLKVNMTPVYANTGVNCDSNIIINFNKEVKAEQLESFENISISDRYGNSLQEYFKTPTLLENKKTIVIKTIGSNPILSESDSGTKNVYVSINKNIIDIAEGITLEDYYGDTGYVGYYCVNNTRTEIKPILNSVCIASNKDNLSISDNNFVQYSDAVKITKKNVFKDSLAIKCNVNNETEISCISVIAKEVTDIYGNKLRDKTNSFLIKEFSSTELSDGSIEIEALINSNKNKTIAEEISKLADGVIELKVAVYNYANKVSEDAYKYWIVKDTKETSAFSMLKNDQYEDGGSTPDLSKDKWEGQSGNTTIYWKCDSDVYATVDTEVFETKIDELLFRIEWGNEYKNPSHSVTVSGADVYNTNKDQCSYTISIDNKYKDTYIKIVAIDLQGNESYIERALPKTISVAFVQTGDNYIQSFYFINECNINIPTTYNRSNVTMYIWDGASIRSVTGDQKKAYISINENLDDEKAILQNCYDYGVTGKLYSSLGDEHTIKYIYGVNLETNIYIYDLKIEQSPVPNTDYVVLKGKIANYDPNWKFYISTFDGTNSVIKAIDDIVSINKVYDVYTKENAVESKIYTSQQQYEFSTEAFCTEYLQISISTWKNGGLGAGRIFTDTNKYTISASDITFTKDGSSNGVIFDTGSQYDHYSDYDSIAPFITYDSGDTVTSGGSFVFDESIDNESGLREASWSSTNTEFEYSWVLYDNVTDEAGYFLVDDITNSQFESLETIYGSSVLVKNNDPKETQCLEVYPKDLIDGNKYVGYIKGYDLHGNYDIVNTYVYLMSTLKNKLECKKNYKVNAVTNKTYVDSVNLKIKKEDIDGSIFFNEYNQIDCGYDMTAGVFDSTLGGWINGFGLRIDLLTLENGNYIESQFDVSGAAYENKYIRVSGAHSYWIKYVPDPDHPGDWMGGIDLIAYSYPVYFWTGDTTCTLKNMVDGLGGISIICAEPCLFYICTSKIGYGDNMDEWERRGAHILPTQTSTSMNVDTTHVNPGDYYVVIAHFVDGTTLMSSVHQK